MDKIKVAKELVKLAKSLIANKTTGSGKFKNYKETYWQFEGERNNFIETTVLNGIFDENYFNKRVEETKQYLMNIFNKIKEKNNELEFKEFLYMVGGDGLTISLHFNTTDYDEDSLKIVTKTLSQM